MTSGDKTPSPGLYILKSVVTALKIRLNDSKTLTSKHILLCHDCQRFHLTWKPTDP